MTVQTKTENALDQFVSETRRLFASQADPGRRWEELAPILSKLLADPEVIEASKNWPDCVHAEGQAENLLFYEDPEFGFAINGLTKGNNRGVGTRSEALPRIHDHAHIFTLYGVLDGHERIERWARLDDRSRPDFAEIVKTDDVFVGPGEIDLVRPYEIHREISTGERTVAIIVRSEKGGGFNQGRYEPETGRYYESLGPRQTPCEMLPTKP
jgi:predicted metal-dependent enzyme (double-stranded beta helix superfamily)